MSVSNAPHKEKVRQGGSSLAILAACLVLAIVVIVLGVKNHGLKAQVADVQKQLIEAKSEATTAQNELVQAKAASADLQSQLDKGKSQLTDLQSQLDRSKDASTQLQSQLDKAKAQSVDLQAQVDKAKAQSADLETQLHQATAGSSELLTQLDQAKIRTMDLQSRLNRAEEDIAQLQPLLLKARHMPVTTSFEKAQWGRSFTLHINNLNQQPLDVNITVTGVQKTRTQANTIATGATLSLEKLAAGENVVIASDGYDPVNVTIQ